MRTFSLCPRPRRLLGASAVILGAAVAVSALLVTAGPFRLGRVRGTSMLPTLRAGDLVIMRQGGDYVPGTIAAYRNVGEGRSVLHRIVWSDGQRFMFQGDHNGTHDTVVVPRSEVMSVLVTRVPLLGSRALVWAGSAAALTAIWAGPLLRRLRRRRQASSSSHCPALASRSPRPCSV
jgi:hypothetical protein